MKIAYLDLSLRIIESQSLYPTKYGGGSAFSKYCKHFSNFFIFAKKECFDDLTNKDNKNNCVVINQEQINRLLNLEPLQKVIPQLVNFDLLIHAVPEFWININELNIKQICWSVGFQEIIHEKHEYLLLYNDFQEPKRKNPDVKIYTFTLGKKIPEFQEYKKEDYIFQCSRIVQDFCSIEVATFCLKNKIKGIFAGPIYPDYPFLNFIDNKYTYYLGEISEEQKINLTKHARLYTLLFNWPAPMSLSMLESLSFGTPVVTTWCPFTNSIVRDRINGFFSFNDNDLLNAWNKAPEISQFNCWSSVLKYNHYNMIDSLYDCFNQILS